MGLSSIMGAPGQLAEIGEQGRHSHFIHPTNRYARISSDPFGLNFLRARPDASATASTNTRTSSGPSHPNKSTSSDTYTRQPINYLCIINAKDNTHEDVTALSHLPNLP